MRRKLFFWLDKLKITHTERLAISVFLIAFAALLLINAIISPLSPFDDEYYSELDARFQMRTALIQQEEQQILSRYRGEQASIASTDTLAPDSNAVQSIADIPEAALININSADAVSLQHLRGIGEAYARRIIEYRKQNGPFQSISDLLNIKGIGEIRLRKISPFITLAKENSTEVEQKKDIEPEVSDDQVNAKGQKNFKGEGEDEAQPRNMVQDKVVGEVKFKNMAEVEAKGNSESSFIINVNNANTAALQKISGIGPAYARRIVEYRQLIGPFKTKEQLLNIKGIGKKRLAKIKPFIKLTD